MKVLTKSVIKLIQCSVLQESKPVHPEEMIDTANPQTKSMYDHLRLNIIPHLSSNTNRLYNLVFLT
eukprot:2668577-Amphidinium_carterae.2